MGKLDLAGQLQAENKTRKGPPCTFQTVFSSLDSDDAVALQEALDDLTVKHTTIYRVLTNNGFNVSMHTIARHRRRECLCGTD